MVSSREKNLFLRWSFWRMLFGMKHLSTKWQVGDGREARLADYVLAKARRGDAADELLVRCLRVDRVARIDIALAGSRLGNAVDLDEFRSLAVGAEVGSGLPWRDIGKCFGGGATCNDSSRQARR